jgi:hypothetical protein
MYISDTDLIKSPMLVPNVVKVDFSCFRSLKYFSNIVDAMFGLKWPKLKADFVQTSIYSLF